MFGTVIGAIIGGKRPIIASATPWVRPKIAGRSWVITGDGRRRTAKLYQECSIFADCRQLLPGDQSLGTEEPSGFGPLVYPCRYL